MNRSMRSRVVLMVKTRLAGASEKVRRLPSCRSASKRKPSGTMRSRTRIAGLPVGSRPSQTDRGAIIQRLALAIDQLLPAE
jgi:hypothetical protein